VRVRLAILANQIENRSRIQSISRDNRIIEDRRGRSFLVGRSRSPVQRGKQKAVLIRWRERVRGGASRDNFDQNIGRARKVDSNTLRPASRERERGRERE